MGWPYRECSRKVDSLGWPLLVSLASPLLMRVPIVIDRASDLALHRQIYEAWRQGILAGRFRRGARLPSTRELATALAVSRTTTTSAYDQLIAEGYLESLHGSGTYVCRALPE